MNHLEENKYYMHIHTGSVALGSEWVEDFEEQEDVKDWDEWEGDDLCEVTQDENGDWVEVE